VATADETAALTGALSAAGFVAAEEEADELLAFAGGDAALLDRAVGRRLKGEPLPWITGTTLFCGREIRVDPGVYVPRWQTTDLALRALERLPIQGVAVDLCTGTGAIARVLMDGRPEARVMATEVDERSAACARANGVDVYLGDLFGPLPEDLERTVDVIVAVVPYVPTPALALLPRDTLVFESPLSYDGGGDGTGILRRVVGESPRFLRPGGALLLELGGEQADALGADFEGSGFSDSRLLVDEDGDVRGIEVTFGR
jgi:release factor glutamine methyltransferase